MSRFVALEHLPQLRGQGHWGRGELAGAQQMAAHSDPKTTRLYDRRNDEVTMDEVERIGI
jgi:hypothetical protein